MSDKAKVAILDDYQHVAFKFADWSPIIDKLDIDVFDDTLHDEVKLAERLQPYTIICAMRERTKFPQSLLDKLPNLRLIASTGPKNRGIDVSYAKSKGIVVSRTSVRGDFTVEHIWTLIQATARHLVHEHLNIIKCDPSIPWQTFVPLGLSGRTLGIVGAGKLGQSTAKIAKAFNMQVIAWSPHLTSEKAELAGVGFVSSKERLFEQSDIVSVHMVLSESTRGLIGASDFARMKPTAFFINTSRGPLVDETALIDALKQKKLAGAGLDVFDVEPLPIDHPLRKLDNVTLSPHTGYVSDISYEVFFRDTVENIQAFLKESPVRVLEE